MVTVPILWLQKYLKVLRIGHNWAGWLKAYMAEPPPREN